MSREWIVQVVLGFIRDMFQSRTAADDAVNWIFAV
jgi:hypothetical protein